MNLIFKSGIYPRKLTPQQQIDLATEYAKPQFISALIAEELFFKDKYTQAMFIGAKGEAEDYKILLYIVDTALRFSLN